MSGYYRMHRGWMENEFFAREAYSERDAWMWMIESAAWKPSRARVKGDTVQLERGQLTFSVRFMAEKWQWSKSRVDRFLKRLGAEGMISSCSKIGTTAGHAAGQGQSIITICNYAKYQASGDGAWDSENSPSGTTAGQQRDNSGTKKNEGNKGNKKIGDKPLSNADANARDPFSVCPDGVDPDHWRDFLKARRKKRCVSTETAYAGVLADLAKFADDEWPPGRLVQRSAAKGWASIVDPHDQDIRNGPRTQQPASFQGNSVRGSRPDPALDMWRQANADIAAEQDQEAGFGTWVSLPALGSG